MTHALSPFYQLLVAVRRLAHSASLSIAAAVMLAFTSSGAIAQCLPNLSPNATEVCVGIPFTITSTPLFPGTYTWRRNGVIVQIGGLTYSRAAATATDSGTYTLTNVSGVPFFCNTASAGVTVVVATTLAFTIQPTPIQTVCAGANVSLVVANTGVPTTYQWRRNGVNLIDGVNANGTVISGATSASLTLGSLAAADAGTYTCRISNDCNSLVSTQALISVRSLASVTNPVSASGCEGDTVGFSVVASGTGPLTINWRRNGVNLVNGINANGTVVAGATTTSLTLTGIAAADAGVYSCSVSNVCNTDISASVSLVVAGVPVITNQPDPVAVCAGGNASFIVSANSPGGGLLTFQWRRNGVNMANGVNGNGTTVAGVTTANLTLASVATGDGATYTCAVRNGCPLNNTTISVGALLTVQTSSSIVSSPASRAACELGSTSFFVGVLAGSPAPTVQWQLNGVNLVNGFGISGANTTTLTLTNLSPTDAGNYRAVVTSLCGSVTSGFAVLTINRQVIITLQPIDQTVCQFANVTFSTAATGFAPITFQWFKDGISLVNGAGVSGATTAILSLTSVSRTDSGVYFCRLTNPCDVDDTVFRTLTVQEVAIQSSGVNVTTCIFTNASFTVVADGTPAPAFQWRFNNVNIANGVNANGTSVLGATSATLTLNSIAAGDAGSYSCAVSNLCDTDISSARTLTVNSQVTVTAPLATTLCEGMLAAFSVTVTGSPAPTLQWQRNNVNLVNGVNIVGTIIGGANTTSLTLSSVDPFDAGSYRCIVGNVCDADTSSAAVLTVNPATRVATPPADRTACPGSNTSFSVAGVSGSPLITFQWRRNGVNLINGVNGNGTTVAGVTTTAVSLSSLAAADAGAYTCLVSGGCSNFLTAAGNLTIGTPVVINTQPVASTQCAGTNKTFSVVATVTPAPTFQWQRNTVNINDGTTGTGTVITGATTASLTLSSIDIADAGSYRCIISTPCDTAISSAASLNVTPGTFITSSPAPVAILDGGNAAFAISAAGTSPITFQWQRNGVNLGNGVKANGTIIGGATAASLSLASAAPDETGTYRCVITSPCGSFNSGSAALVVAINLGTVTAGTLSGAIVKPSDEVRWFRFTSTLDAVDPVRYLDIHTVGSTEIDTEVGVYRTDGTLVASNDDVGSFGLSLLSFGQVSPVRQYPPIVGDTSTNSSPGTLLAGTYFVAVGGFNVTFGITGFVITDGGPAGVYSVTVIAGVAVNPCLSDVNTDGIIDGNDFTAFINSFGVGDPAIDPTADVNLDGIIDGNDFVAFINAFGAGC